MTRTLRPKITSSLSGRHAVAALAGVVVALLISTAFTATALAAPPKSTRSLVVSTKKLPGLGTVLVNAKGLTLYMFVPDKRRKVTCVQTCAAVWPPLTRPAHGKLVAQGAAKFKLLATDPDPEGGRVVTYHGWPLYTYIADKKPGMATGQAINLNGGLWYVLAPSGKVIKTKPAK